MKTAVVVLNWNGLDLLKTFLPALEAYSKEAELWVIDNGSTDASSEYVNKNHPEIKCLVLDKNYGYAEGYNKGLTKIEADLYCLINSDIKVQEHWLESVITHFKENPNTAAAQPHILDLNRPEYFEYAGAAGGEIDTYGYAFCRGRIFGSIEKNEKQYAGTSKIMWASGACFFVRSNFFWECNGFDPLFFAHQEEIDLCWRFHHKGHDVMALDGVAVFHLGGATLAPSPQKTFLNFRNTLFLLYKNLPATLLFFTLFKRLVLDGIAGAYFILNAKPQHCWAILKAHMAFYKMLYAKKLQRPDIVKPYPFKVKSVVYQYFIAGNKKFTDIVKN